MGKFTPKNGGPSGTVDGFVVSNNHNGNILRGRGIPIKRQTPDNSPKKSVFNRIATRWSNLTETQQNTWRAATINGVSGYNAFQSVGLNKRIFGLDISITPSPATIAAVWTNSVISGATHPLAVNLTVTTGGTQYGLLVEATGKVSGGTDSVTDSDYKALKTIQPFVSGLYDVDAEWEALYGTLLPGEGRKVFVRTTVFWVPRGVRGVSLELPIVIFG